MTEESPSRAAGRLGPALSRVIGSLMIVSVWPAMPVLFSGLDVPPGTASVITTLLDVMGWMAGVVGFISFVHLAFVLRSLSEQNEKEETVDASRSPTAAATLLVRAITPPGISSNIGGSVQDPTPAIRSRWAASGPSQDGTSTPSNVSKR